MTAAGVKKYRTSRNALLDHLPYEEVVIEPDSKSCPCCGGDLHQIGEDRSKRLDKIPASGARDRHAAAEVCVSHLRKDGR